jgi:hypothetical protein
MICDVCQHDVHPVREMFERNKFVSKCPRHECGAPMADDVPVSVSPNRDDELAHLRSEIEILSGIATPSDEHLAQLGAVRQRLARLENPAPPMPRLAVQPVITELPSTGRIAPPLPPSPAVAGAPVDFLDQVRQRLLVIDEQIAGLEKLKAEGRKLRAMLAAAEAADAN